MSTLTEKKKLVQVTEHCRFVRQENKDVHVHVEYPSPDVKPFLIKIKAREWVDLVRVMAGMVSVEEAEYKPDSSVHGEGNKGEG